MVCKRKRPPNEAEYVVKCCLRKRLLVPQIIPRLEAYVENSSKLIHHGSLLLNHFVCDRLSRGEAVSGQMLADQMFYYGAFSVVAGARRTKHPELLDFFNTKKHLHPEGLRRIPGDSPIINAAAKQYATNVATYLKVTFQARLRKAVKALLPDGTSRGDISAVCWWIRGMPQYSCCRVLSEAQDALVGRIRGVLMDPQPAQNDQVVSDVWIKRNMGRVLGFFAWVLRQAEELGVRRFNLLPVASQKRHFIAISSKVLQTLLTDVGAVKKDLDPRTFVQLIDEHRRSVFRVRSSWKLGDTIETDGVSVCFHLRRARPAAEPKKKKKPQTTTQHQGDDLDVVGVDPGRCNIASTVQKTADGAWKKCRLTRKQFYRDSHVHDNLVKLQKLDSKHVGAEMASLSEAVGKTADLAEYEAYLTTKKAVDSRLWEHRLGRRFAAMAMDNYIHKRKTVDRFWKRTVGLRPGLVVAYGDAGFASSGCGERSVPTGKMKEAAGRFGRVVEVDEFRTSRTCCECGSNLLPVYVPGNPRPLRAVRRCGSIECNEAPPVDLFMAYYHSQTDGSGIHSPEVCIPAGGWEVSRWERVPVTLDSGVTVTVNRATIQQGINLQIVYFWFEQRGRRLTSDYAAKIYTVMDSLTMGRSDGGLVRLITPVSGPDGEAAADERLRSFMEYLVPALPRFMPD